MPEKSVLFKSQGHHFPTKFKATYGRIELTSDSILFFGPNAIRGGTPTLTIDLASIKGFDRVRQGFTTKVLNFRMNDGSSLRLSIAKFDPFFKELTQHLSTFYGLSYLCGNHWKVGTKKEMSEVTFNTPHSPQIPEAPQDIVGMAADCPACNGSIAPMRAEEVAPDAKTTGEFQIGSDYPLTSNKLPFTSSWIVTDKELKISLIRGKRMAVIAALPIALLGIGLTVIAGAALAAGEWTVPDMLVTVAFAWLLIGAIYGISNKVFVRLHRTSEISVPHDNIQKITLVHDVGLRPQIPDDDNANKRRSKTSMYPDRVFGCIVDYTLPDGTHASVFGISPEAKQMFHTLSHHVPKSRCSSRNKYWPRSESWFAFAVESAIMLLLSFLPVLGAIGLIFNVLVRSIGYFFECRPLRSRDAKQTGISLVRDMLLLTGSVALTWHVFQL